MTLARLLMRTGGGGRKGIGRFALAGLASIGRLPFSLLERAYTGFRRSSAIRSEPPIFIVGHWRSGTTHLYNVLSQSSRFAYVSPYATALPWDFLLLGKWLSGLLERALPKQRYIDSIPVTPTSPQEDEIGLANMTTLSFYHALYFPKHFGRFFREGLYFDGVAPHEVGEWRRLLRYYYLKLSIEQPGRRLLIKNPVYTARIALLKSMWPEAKFIHIYRNPYKVFFSMRNFYEKLFEEFALQDWDHLDIDEHILETYERMMTAYERDIALVPPHNRIELRFDDFQANPMAEIKSIYDRFGIGGFEDDKPDYEAYLDSVSTYKKNVYTFPEADLKKVGKRLAPFIDRWGYKRPEAKAS